MRHVLPELGAVLMARGGWRMRSFVRRLKNVIEVPSGPADRPGERLLAPAPSIHAPSLVEPDGGRKDFRVPISSQPSSLGAVCIGPVADQGEPRDAAAESAGRYARSGATPAEPCADTVAGEAAWRLRVESPEGVLVDWLFAHGGWLFAAGLAIRGRDDEEEMLARARAVLDTWEWLEPERA